MKWEVPIGASKMLTVALLDRLAAIHWLSDDQEIAPFWGEPGLLIPGSVTVHVAVVMPKGQQQSIESTSVMPTRGSLRPTSPGAHARASTGPLEIPYIPIPAPCEFGAPHG